MTIGQSHLADIEEGLVRDLVSGATYYAAKGHGAKLNGRPIHVHPYDPKDILFTVYLGSNAHPDADRVARLARRGRSLGAASLDLCLVARGAADLDDRHSGVVHTKLRARDIAAVAWYVRA